MADSLPAAPAEVSLEKIKTHIEKTLSERVGSTLRPLSNVIAKSINDTFAKDFGANHGMAVHIAAEVETLTNRLSAQAFAILKNAAMQELTRDLRDRAEALKL